MRYYVAKNQIDRIKAGLDALNPGDGERCGAMSAHAARLFINEKFGVSIENGPAVETLEKLAQIADRIVIEKSANQ